MSLRSDLALISEWVKPNAHVLDLGCGDGTLLAHLRDTRQVTGYGLEIDPDNITRCIEADINVIQSDLNQGLAEFANHSFDYVIMTQTLQAVERPDILLTEMLRVGEEGIVTFPNFGYWKSRLQLFTKGKMPISDALPNTWYDTDNTHLCTVRDFEDLCALHNIEILRWAAVDLQHRTSRWMNLMPNLLGEVALYHFHRK